MLVDVARLGQLSIHVRRLSGNAGRWSGACRRRSPRPNSLDPPGLCRDDGCGRRLATEQTFRRSGKALSRVTFWKTLQGSRRFEHHPCMSALAKALADLRSTFDPHPPVTLMCRATAGFFERRSMMKSWPLGLREMASSMAWPRATSPLVARRTPRRSAASSWPRHM